MVYFEHYLLITFKNYNPVKNLYKSLHKSVPQTSHRIMTMYTAEHFTDEHAKLLGDYTVEEYHTIAAKYTTDIQLQTIDVMSETLEEQMRAELEKKHMVLVTGVMHNTSDGVMEQKEEFQRLIGCIKTVTKDTDGKNYIHILGPHKTAYPHPKLLKALEEGTYNLEGGFWATGQQMPEETIIAEKMINGEVEFTTNLMCSVLSNFHLTKTAGITARSLGCNPEKVPREAMDVAFLSAEHAIQLAKAAAVLAFPTIYMDLEASDSNLERAIEGVDKLRGGTLKRRIEGGKSDRIINHCAEVYTLLSTASTFETQKKLGQYVILSKRWFDVVGGTPLIKYRNFDASDLKKLGTNSIMQAFAIMLRVHGGDVELYDRLVFDIETNNVPVESAMHDPVKASAGSEAKYLFSGRFPDRVWGKVCGCPRYTVKPDSLIHKDGKPQVGHLGNGAELVRQAMKGDKDVLAFFGLDAPLTLDTMRAGAAAAFDKFWEAVRA